MAYDEPSPTALALWDLCPARAVGRYVHGIKEDFGKAAREGVRAHRLTQRFLAYGDAPPPSAAHVRATISVLPVGAAAISPHNIERVVLLRAKGIQLNGGIDWEAAPNLQGDLKFTGDLRHLRARDWLADHQRIIYAADWFARHPGESTVRSIWTGSRFDGRKAENYELRLKRRQVEKLLDDVSLRVAEKLLDACSRQRDWQSMPKNPGACNLYPPNGCPMRAHGCKMNARKALLTLRPKNVGGK